ELVNNYVRSLMNQVVSTLESLNYVANIDDIEIRSKWQQLAAPNVCAVRRWTRWQHTAFNQVISEMIEAVVHQYMQEFFGCCYFKYDIRKKYCGNIFAGGYCHNSIRKK
ncbi:hypothetical protein Tco_0540593, partial [Tanacetum coccineum]